MGWLFRSKCNNLDAITKAVHATLAISCSFIMFSKQFVPTTKVGVDLSPGLPLSVIEPSQRVYQSLSSQDLIEKCLHDKTRNQNECFKGT